MTWGMDTHSSHGAPLNSMKKLILESKGDEIVKRTASQEDFQV